METSRHRSDGPDALFEKWRATGDAAALGALFDGTARDLFRIAATLVPDAATAEDAVQETFLAAIEFAPRWDPSRPVVPWLVGILRHKVEALRRDRRRAPDTARVAVRLPPLDPHGVAELREDAERVLAAMDALPEPFRQTALLRWRHGLEPAEIAHLTGETPGSIRVRLHRALTRLRERMRSGAALALVAGTGSRERGLPAVREAVMRRGLVAGRAVVTAAVAGGFAMGSKSVVAAVALVLVAAGAWWFVRDDAPRPDADAASHDAAGGQQTSARAGRADAPVATAAVPETPPRAPTGPAISGRVLDAAGRPVPGARVVAFVPEADALIDLASIGPDATTGAAATSGSDGAFRVPVRDGADHDLVANADGFAPAVRERVRAGEAGDLVLRAEPAWTGRVLGAHGRPVAGVQVRLLGVLGGAGLDVRSAVSAADGTFRLAGAGILEVRAEGFAPSQAPLVAPRDGSVQDIVLFPGVPLEVLVVDGHTGARVEGADVRYGLHAAPAPARSPRRVPRPDADLDRATTGPDGRAVFAHAASERSTPYLFVRAWKAGRTAETVNVTDRGETGRMTAKIETWPVASVRGRVVDTKGAPVAGCAISVEPDAPVWFPAPFGERPWMGVVLTDADGRFIRRAVRGGTGSPYQARVVVPPPWGDRGADVGFAITDRKLVPFEALAGAESDVGEIVLGAPRPLPRASFVVRGADGRPVAGARLAAPGALVPEFVTDAQGRALLRWSADPTLQPPSALGPDGTPAAARRVRVSATGHAPVLVDVTPSATAPPEATVVLGAPRRLAGQVTEADGSPVPGAQVWVVCGDGERAMQISGQADDAGRFVLDDLPAGPVELHACTISGARGNARETVLRDVAPGGPDATIVLVADVCETGGIEGTVTDSATGAPVVAAFVEVGSVPFSARCETSQIPAGRFRLPDVPAGSWSVRVGARGRLTELCTVTVPARGTARLDVAIARGAVVVGRVRFPEGTQLRSPIVKLVRTDLGPADREPPSPGGFAWISKDGTFQIAGVRPGTYVMIARPANSESDAFVAAERLVVAANAAGPVEADVAPVPAGQVSVGVSDTAVPAPPSDEDAERTAESQFPPGAIVELLDERGGRVGIERRVYRGSGAGFVAAPGRYEVVLHLPGGATRRSPAEVRAGATTEVEFGGR